MNILVFETEEQLDTYAGKYIADYIRSHASSVIGFATGSTPLGLYAHLISEYQQGKLDFSDVLAFNLDEYVGVEKTHPNSFATAMRENLFMHINLPSENIFSLNGAAVDMDKECERYEKCIKEHPIDIQILGIGMDGHIAYNEPKTSFDSQCHVVELHQKSIESSLNYGFRRIEDVPKQGVTQGIATILQAKELLMIAKGEKKAKLVERMLYGEVCEDFPSSIIQKHENVTVLLDQGAAIYLKQS